MSEGDREICSWTDFVAYVEANHVEAVISGKQRARFGLRYRDRAELVLAWCHKSATGAPWLGLAVSLGHHSLFRKRPSLVANQRLPIGGLTLLRDSMLLVQTLPLNRLRVAHIEETLTALAATVATLSDSSLPDAPEGAPFAYVFTSRTGGVTP